MPICFDLKWGCDPEFEKPWSMRLFSLNLLAFLCSLSFKHETVRAHPTSLFLIFYFVVFCHQLPIFLLNFLVNITSSYILECCFG